MEFVLIVLRKAGNNNINILKLKQEIVMAKSKAVCGKFYIKQLKNMERELSLYPPLWENRLFEREIKELIKTAKDKYITVNDKKMTLGEQVSQLDDINSENVKDLLYKYSQIQYVGESDINSLVWCGKFCVISDALAFCRKNASSADLSQNHNTNCKIFYKKLYGLRDLNEEELGELSPLHSAFSRDEIYSKSSAETKAMYRQKASLLARETGIGEERYIPELVNRAVKNNIHIGQVIKTDYRNVFPYAKSVPYIIWVTAVSVLLSLIIGFFTRLWLSPLLFFPVFSAVKPFADLILSRKTHSYPLPRMDLDLYYKDSPTGKGETLCVISALVSDEESIREALERLKNAQLRNPQKQLYFALLLDLPAGSFREIHKDSLLFSAAERLRQEIFPQSVIFFRKRTYCKTMNKWQGFERKRGAIEQLMQYLRNDSWDIDYNSSGSEISDSKGNSSDSSNFSDSETISSSVNSAGTVSIDNTAANNTNITANSADIKASSIPHTSSSSPFACIFANPQTLKKIKSCEFLCALDLDTQPLMDSIKELTAIALHPLNKDYGIIAPRCTSTLNSTLKTPFARAMAGNGGASGISSYDSFCGEFYFDNFGEGIFCGKGLIRIDDFLKRCKDKLPIERVLSHDILEGGFTGVAFAGDCEFSDSFPATSKAYFKRAHRWIRGDFQNLRFIFKMEFSPLTKFKLFDNFRRGITPFFILLLLFLSCFLNKGTLIAITAYCGLLLAFATPLTASVKRGFAFGITRRFYSPIVSETAQLGLRCLMEIMTLPKAALVSLDAALKTLYRTVISKKNLLQWTTSGFLEKTAFKGNAVSLLPAFILSLLLLICSVLGGNPLVFFGANLMCAAFPFFLYADREENTQKPMLDNKAQRELLSHTEKMWSFFTRYTDQSTNYLPPDNVQFFPVYCVCYRTSPTNIGMYLLSAAAVYSLGIIDKNRLVETVEKTVESVERLEKYKGNLYNWYDIKSLHKLSNFVSSVDSGNFTACLIAVKECLIQNKIFSESSDLISRCEKIIDNTDLSCFYCKDKNLFSIGCDLDNSDKSDKSGENLSPHKYDMLMSEARLLSYTAIALGQVPKKHWRFLSRTMSRNGRYAGAIAWTGTMFEFFMPELLLTSKEGSMSYESLRYCFYCQKQRHKPFGISESGYYAFDRDLNYQYKAHGVQKTALKADMDKECVVSPYSSYLTMSSHPLESWNNLVLLEQEGAFNPDYGFYEAIDYTRDRTGGKAVVKSHMAHHMGMSICGCANALKDNICSRLFLNDEKMKRAEELLEERVMSGEKVLKITGRQYEAEAQNCENEIIEEQRAEGSPVNTLWGGGLSLFTSANGCFYSCYKGKAAVRKTEDFLNRPYGAFYGFCTENKVYPLFVHPKLTSSLGKLKTVFSANQTEYVLEEEDFVFTMTVWAENNTEFRRFTAKNNSDSKKQIILCGYSEPVLANSRDYEAHPMFLDLFLKIEHLKDKNLFKIYRKDRKGENVTVCCGGFTDNQDYSYCLSREDCTDYNDFSFFKNAFIRSDIDKSIPNPCLFIKNCLTLDKGEEKSCTLFYCYGDSILETENKADSIRSSGNNGINVPIFYSDKPNNIKNGLNAEIPSEKADYRQASPLSLNTLQGRIAEKILPSILYGEISQSKILNARKNNILNKKELWRFGISGDFPFIVSHASDMNSERLKIIGLLKSGLDSCGIRCDLIVICSDSLQKEQAEKALMGNGYILLLDKNKQQDRDIITLIYSLSAYVDLQDLAKGGETDRTDKIIDNNKNNEMPKALPLLPCGHNKSESKGFSDNSYIIEDENNTWCNILSSPNFGTLASQNSLGFTYALNSRENKLTPWSNDIIKDNYGEMLLIKLGDIYYDLIRGSRADFSPHSCVYNGNLLSLQSKAEVKVYQTGLAKEISLSLYNGDKACLSFDVVYKIVPLLSSDNKNGTVTAYVVNDNSDKGVVFFNCQNMNYNGLAALYLDIVDNEPVFDFSPLRVLSADFSQSITQSGFYNSPLTAVIIPLKLPPKQNLNIRFILGYYNDPDNTLDFSDIDNTQIANKIKEMITENQSKQDNSSNSQNTKNPQRLLMKQAEDTAKEIGEDKGSYDRELGESQFTSDMQQAAKQTLIDEKRQKAALSALNYVKALKDGKTGFETQRQITIKTNDPYLDNLFNVWLPHQIISSRLWARTGFFQNSGAYGFRDQLQDCLAVMYLSPRLAKAHILNCCLSQFEEGDVLHWWHELEGKRTGVRTRYSDDLLWLPYAACRYNEIYNEKGFWDTESEYCKGEPLPQGKQELFMTIKKSDKKESLYLHCKKAMEKGYNKGKRGLIKIGCGDWNDGYNNVGVKGEGESVWLAMFYIMVGRKFAEAARENNDTSYSEKLEKRIADLTVSIEENAWDGSWYLRAFYDSGEKMGSKDSDECKIDILPQAFSVFAQLPNQDRIITALNSAWDKLTDKKAGIIKLFTPPFNESNMGIKSDGNGKTSESNPESKKSKKTAPNPGYVSSYPEGIRENGGQYTHGAIWYCLACFKAGQTERAAELLKMLNPANKGEEYGREPYFMTADIYTNPQVFGRGGWSMYTGSAAWYWLCIFEGMFGAEIKKGKIVNIKEPENCKIYFSDDNFNNGDL